MKDYNNSAVMDSVASVGLSVGIPPPLPGAVPLSVTTVAELAEAAEVPPPLPVEDVVSLLSDRAEPNFRIEAIRELKSVGVVFDEHDVEFKMETLRSAYLKELEHKLALESELRRTREESALSFLRAKSEAESARESLLRAARESQEAIARKAAAREKRRQSLITIIMIILGLALMTILSLISTG
jgi:hypothetical protein